MNAAHEAGYQSLVTYFFNDARGPNLERLTCNVVIRRAEGARTALVTTSGLHGVEGLIGSYLQTHWMRTLQISGPIDVIHVHALNPWGFAWERRVGPNNVDKNRGFQDVFPTHNINPGYSLFSPLIQPNNPGLLTQAAAVALMIVPSIFVMKPIIQKGQNKHADGLFYTGTGPTWTSQTWEKFIKRYMAQYDQIVHLDLHSGLGKRGGLKIIHSGRKGDDVHQVLRALMPGENIQATGGFGISARVVGDITGSWKLAGLEADRDIISAALEFGVKGPLETLFALQAERAAHFHLKMGDDKWNKAKLGMLDAFAPLHDIDWVNAVEQNADRAMNSLLQNFTP